MGNIQNVIPSYITVLHNRKQLVSQRNSNHLLKADMKRKRGTLYVEVFLRKAINKNPA